MLEEGSALDADELAVADAFVNAGYDVTGLATASSRGIQNQRTADLFVDGMGPVDVFTPQAVNATSIGRAIEKKGTQAPAVVVRGVTSNIVKHATARRFWGKTGSKARAVQQIGFESDGQIQWFHRPR